MRKNIQRNNYNYYHYPECFDSDLKKEVLTLYLKDMTIIEISSWVGLSMEQVNEILDEILPCL